MYQKKIGILKKAAIWSIMAMLVMCYTASGTWDVHGAEKTQASDGKNMEKVLKNYKAGKYKAAKKYNKKMNASAKEKCVKKMSEKHKAAFKKTVRKWENKETEAGYSYLIDYYLTDMNNDKKADLLILKGTCEADTMLVVYMYKNGKSKKVGAIGAGHASFHAYPNHNGIVMHYAHMGWEAMYKITYKKGKLKSTELGYRETNHYFNLRCDLKGAVSYDDDYNRHISYEALQ